MKAKSEFTIIERAVQTIEGFSAVDERIRQQTILRGQSRSTFENYIRKTTLLPNYRLRSQENNKNS